MRENLVLLVWTILGMALLWFIVMAVNRNLFLHSDSDLTIYGTVAINNTDIGNQCGDQYTNSNERVEYKLNKEGKIVYLCPQGLWPIQRTVTALLLTDDFRNSLQPAEQDRLLSTYPIQPAGQPVNPYLAAPQ